MAVFERAAETVVRICYGYGFKANNKWKETLGAEWRQYEKSFPLLQQSSIDTVSLECIHSHVPLELVELIRGKNVMLGAIDVATEKVETPEEVAEVLRRALEFVDADKLIPSSNCGTAPLARDAALNKLGALSAGADIVRAELVGAGVPSARLPSRNTSTTFFRKEESRRPCCVRRVRGCRSAWRRGFRPPDRLRWNWRPLLTRCGPLGSAADSTTGNTDLLTVQLKRFTTALQAAQLPPPADHSSAPSDLCPSREG